MLSEIIQEKKGFWNSNGPRHDIVVSTRVRLSRNIPGISFPHGLDLPDLDRINYLVEKYRSAGEYSGRLKLLKISDIENGDKRFLRERNLITNEMENSEISSALIDMENEFTVLINDEDHIKIQSILPGLQLTNAWEKANSVDSDMNRFINYAFSEKFGYLMAKPERNGTGMKVSVILHLPVLTEKKRIGEFLPSIKESGFNISGTLGNSERVTGDLYVLSNDNTQWLSEVDVLDRTDSIVSNLIKLEDDARDDFLNSSKIDFEDLVLRSLGILKYSRRLTYGESIEHLSKVRLGVVMSIIRDCSINLVNDLMVNVQWSHLQYMTGRTFKSVIESDEYRSTFVRNMLQKAGEQ